MQTINSEGIIKPVLLGYPEQIRSKMEELGLDDLKDIPIIHPSQHPKFREYVDKLYEAEALAQQRLSVAPLDMGDANKAQTDAAAAQQAAAEKQAQAADAQIAAAREVAVAAQQIAAAASSMAQSGSTGWAAIRDLSSGLSALRPMEVGY